MRAYHLTERANWDQIQQEGILSYDEQADPAAWKWNEAPVGHDGYWVSLFREEQLDEARWFANDYLTDTVIIELDLPEADEAEAWGLRYGLNDEGYLSVAHQIPAQYIVGLV